MTPFRVFGAVIGAVVLLVRQPLPWLPTIFHRGLPGTLQAIGEFIYDPGPHEPATLAESERDFARIAASKRDLWVFTPEERTAGAVLPVNLPSSGGAAHGFHEKIARMELKLWLQRSLAPSSGPSAAPTEVQRSASVPRSIVDRVISLISVRPGLEFVIANQVVPRIMQPKYVLIVSRSGQVRVAWYGFASDSQAPGSTSGPVVVKLVSENLNSEAKRQQQTIFVSSARATSIMDIESVVASHAELIMMGVDDDMWEAYATA